MASLWALTEDETGIPALIHRKIPYCKIVPTGGGRGTPRGWTSDDQFRDVGPIRYEVVTVSQNNVVQFVNYFGSNGVVRTGFPGLLSGTKRHVHPGSRDYPCHTFFSRCSHTHANSC